MGKLTIANSAELNDWMDAKRSMGRDMVAVKGEAPEGATYSDGEPITQPVNVAWQCVQTGEIFAIEYEVQP